MKKVLAELHQLINSLEDHGLTAEASSLQEVFVRVAQKADPNDLSEKVTDLLGKYSAPELIAALAEQMDSKDTKTMSFAYGEEPRDVIVNEFVDQAKNKDMRQDDAYFMMNQRLQFNGHPTLTKQEFDAKVNSSGTNISEFAFGDDPEEFTESERTLGTPKNPLYKGTEGPHRMHGGYRISPMRQQPLPRQSEPAPYRQPAYQIMNEFIGQAIKGDMSPDDAYFMMNQRLESNGRETISKPQFDTYVKNKSEINPNLTVRQGIVPPSNDYDPEAFKRELEEMNKKYIGGGDYTRSGPD